MGFFDMLKLFWSGWLLPFLESLPETLRKAGDGIESAGKSAIKAGRFINGGGNVTPNARDTINLAAGVINDCNDVIKNAATLLKNAGNDINSVKVPTITPSFITINVGFASYRVVSGLVFGETSLFGNVASGMKNSADDLSDVGTKLQVASTHLYNLRDALKDTGDDLERAGEKLKESGQALREFASSQ